MSQLVYEVYRLFFPGSPLTFQDWASCCESLLLGVVVASAIGALVFWIHSGVQLVSRPSDVFSLHNPLRWGVAVSWIVLIGWVLYHIFFVAGLAKAPAFLNVKPFLFVVACGVVSWLVVTVAVSMLARMRARERYRYVTFVNRIGGGA